MGVKTILFNQICSDYFYLKRRINNLNRATSKSFHAALRDILHINIHAHFWKAVNAAQILQVAQCLEHLVHALFFFSWIKNIACNKLYFIASSYQVHLNGMPDI